MLSALGLTTNCLLSLTTAWIQILAFAIVKNQQIDDLHKGLLNIYIGLLIICNKGLITDPEKRRVHLVLGKLRQSFMPSSKDVHLELRKFYMYM